MSQWVILLHGDLLTKERLDSIRESRAIEDTPKRRFQHLIFLPGLFHYKMACADALWRTWVQPKDSRIDENSLFKNVGEIRPDETGKFGTKPGFRRTHDVIHHDLWASILDCWRLDARKRNSSWTSLKAFAHARPSWDLITEMSESIVKNYVATTPNLSDLRRRPAQARDKQFENQTLRNRDELLYVELCHAMNAGDIGRVEASFLPWSYIFKATGKHKYASQILLFEKDLREKFSAELRDIIRKNWLVNPTGKPHAFRGADWVVERNNLYTKVIFAGGSSNKTIDHIVKESPLIELYRECHVTVENGFHLEHRTIRHAPPNMTKTLRKLREKLEHRTRPHVLSPARTSRYAVPDQIAAGMNILLTRKDSNSSTVEEEHLDVEGDDLADD
ncbi:hypothetical protein PLICRDRAFT_106940 [Plicaturopsis crispa FD-325 SS-3]|nr:hypothetical protein PLICRDRAFT_106940 [Plicaturopsis crispa FD-325 SS-3]